MQTSYKKLIQATRGVYMRIASCLVRGPDFNRSLYLSGFFVLLLLSPFTLDAVAQETIEQCLGKHATPIRQVNPSIPNTREARELLEKKDQHVELRFILNPDGTVEEVKASTSSSRVFVRSAKAALKKTRFMRPQKACKMKRSFTFKIRK